ncbi:MAG: hypothetical protein A3D16_23210 [Rhodobacterales bacterium RIFCSPHIGHO2_02_FULL_62_130]|nr:MAG: hypothetical protein A3D16_23210 [Rhodobacterales bacterium RIFCSPHIGHO2_02_FULL_62_130]OHC54317.1 MAG: hypothetical protein A3E48_19290 [Rhodobacterales bacterium RIFCSPHIGHO2_12_FULL_62_75]HCY98530.1 YIP1 family protein [Rhodobacter sp.]
MNLSLNVLMSAARYTLQNPRAGARLILSVGLSTGQAMGALVLMAVLSTLLTSVSILVAPVPAGAELQLMFANPLQLAVMQAMILTMGAGLIHAVGTKFGGKGNFAGAVALIAWIEFILSLMQIVQLVALVVMPPLADVIGVMGLGVFLWLLSQFVTELHGFANVWKVFGAIIVTGLGVSFAVAMVLVSIFGVGV